MEDPEPDTECFQVALYFPGLRRTLHAQASPSVTLNDACHHFIAYVALLISHILLSSELLPLFSKGVVFTKKRDQVTSGLQGHIQEREANAILIRTNLSCEIISPQSTHSNPPSGEINRRLPILVLSSINQTRPHPPHEQLTNPRLYENCLVNGSDDGLMPLGGQYLGRPERRLVHPFGAIGTGRPIYFNIPDPEPTFALTDLTFPSFVWDADRKREFDIELLREMLTSALGTSRVASRPKVPTRSYCICQWCSDEVSMTTEATYPQRLYPQQ
ncbi:uncharacterized protein LACBIDRAFT_327661 [Laccaria bicolor S238N-H82]|uniref:Predicted protein n=1 Tax=Laccaria bicolor (strain S238N-H82 / ATCC MYA-4686) TaxID=486041 RepID=B0DCF8_LACBS|nr:uncharacterized protein LACBIDRAFT_327661 [Laccaria bicolor S238N-H82]EDR07889.1 predicted protein [Laccaria bicolor S238N-H82]|eukprot:XP_001881678.1 predicted protein [Laccaria bicolor S238N-H82]